MHHSMEHGVAETCFVPRGIRIHSWIVFGFWQFSRIPFLGSKENVFAIQINRRSSPHFVKSFFFAWWDATPWECSICQTGFKKSGYEPITNVALYRGISQKLYCLVHPNLHWFINHICWSPHLLVHCQNSMKGKSSRNSTWNPHGFRTPRKRAMELTGDNKWTINPHIPISTELLQKANIAMENVWKCPT